MKLVDVACSALDSDKDKAHNAYLLGGPAVLSFLCKAESLCQTPLCTPCLQQSFPRSNFNLRSLQEAVPKGLQASCLDKVHSPKMSGYAVENMAQPRKIEFGWYDMVGGTTWYDKQGPHCSKLIP